MLSVRPLLSKIKQALRDSRCVMCQAEGVAAEQLFCQPCFKAFSFQEVTPLRFYQDETPLYAASRFTSKMRRLLYGYKFYEQHAAWRTLSAVLTTYWRMVQAERPISQQVLVCPIPSREGTPSHLTPYAQDFADAFGYRMEACFLQWVRETVPQHSLHRKSDRLANVTGSMTVCENVLKRYKASDSMVLIIVDDILTTGVTLSEAIRAVRATLPKTLEVVGLTLTHIPLSYR